jgi:xylan 1,4-beta-xylosidase
VSEALVVHEGSVAGVEVRASFGPDRNAHIHASWCVFSEPMLRVFRRGVPAAFPEMAPFKYQQYFKSLGEVTAWAKANPSAISENSGKVDRLLIQDSMPRSVTNLMALTLHSWAACSWWTDTPHGEWFTVWEGSCYFHSTMDVEYTQTPFYLAVWPELLGLELDIWPQFVVGGEEVLGEAGHETVIFMHDIGRMNACDTTRYPHHMPVEENTNYVLMSYGYWKRTGDFSRAARNAEIILKALEFVVLCDTTGNGVPDRGTANTIDDASPAVQFGKEQVYLAVKVMAALEVGAEMLEKAGMSGKCVAFREQASKIRKVIEEAGWQGDHFAVLLDKSAHGVTDAWTGKSYGLDELPGWDAAHIYTSNGLTLLDMVGRDVAMDDAKLRMDLKVAAKRCLAKYGCLHSDHKPAENLLSAGEGGVLPSTRPGWISMNMLRDISAFYRGIDLRHLAGRYWEFQTLTNTQGPHLFFETFNGNNLMCYPRGVAVFGYYDALGGVKIDMEQKTLTYRPLDNQVEVPVLLLADWEKGIAPVIREGKLEDAEGLMAQAGIQYV